jgi:molybdenum cofactor synthesis domain-containing protein
VQAAVELITVGNELLIGKTLNTNAHWIAKRVTALGGSLRRITTVPDDVEEIASSIREALRRKPWLLMMVGGLGPTHDDKTLQGVAEALSRPLKVNSQALEMVREKHRELLEKGLTLQRELTSEREKMARLPQGAEPLSNPVGTAPGVMLREENTLILCLPGVPSEMKAIFDEAVAGLITEKAQVQFREESLIVKKVLEPELSPIIDEVMRVYPQVYIKSHPYGEEGHYHIELHFSTSAKTGGEALERIRKAEEMVTELVKKSGGEIQRSEG